MPDAHDHAVTRFAPSPTGHLHVGGARTALFCWALAKKLGGSFLLRIEDTDRARSSEDATAGILEDLAWLGIGWDQGPAHTHAGRMIGGDPAGVGPFYQAQRVELYNEHLRRLIDADMAYPAFDTPDELAAMRAEAQANKQTFRYIRAADYDRDAMLARAEAEAHVVRFRMPAEPIVVRDEVLGEVRFEPEHVDDFVLRKVDGFPTYHLAVAVDDELMGVTHILRGQEHLNNTPRHVALQKALGFRTPAYAHLPLIFNADGSKMSKRDKDKAARDHVKDAIKSDATARATAESVLDGTRLDAWLKDKKSQLETNELVALARAFGMVLPEIDVDDFRRAGYLPEVVINFLALLGWNPGAKNEDGTDLERFDAAYLAENFSLGRLGKSASKFDRAKLLSFNADTIQAMDDAVFAQRMLAWATREDPALIEALPGERWLWAASALKPRAKALADARKVLGFVFEAPTDYDAKAVKKNLLKAPEGEPAGPELLRGVGEALAALEPFAPGAIDAAVEAYAGAQGVKIGRVAQPIRIALTGTAVSPPLGLSLALVGNEEFGARLGRLMDTLAASAET